MGKPDPPGFLLAHTYRGMQLAVSWYSQGDLTVLNHHRFVNVQLKHLYLHWSKSATFTAGRWYTTFDTKELIYGKVSQESLPTSQVLLEHLLRMMPCSVWRKLPGQGRGPSFLKCFQPSQWATSQGGHNAPPQAVHQILKEVCCGEYRLPSNALPDLQYPSLWICTILNNKALHKKNL